MSVLSPFHSTDSRSTMVKNHNENIIKAYMLYPKSVIRKFRFHFVRKHKIYSNYNE